MEDDLKEAILQQQMAQEHGLCASIGQTASAQHMSLMDRASHAIWQLNETKNLLSDPELMMAVRVAIAKQRDELMDLSDWLGTVS